ncbi:MAG TPA: Fur family transcriptional regulator [Candidatus Paceibacterota bacterium]|nr:Fur family transcriptional regulator [Candidatus Paceibacterota bacterium]
MQKKTDFRQVLRKSGFKATPSRLAILEVFRNSRRPLSAQGIIDLLPRGIDQATVYRTLRSLQEKGVIKQIDLRHNHAHYEIADLADHHHLVCLSCGKIENVEHHNVEAMERVILHNAKHFAEIKQHTLEFYGICKACAKRPRAAEKEGS